MTFAPLASEAVIVVTYTPGLRAIPEKRPSPPLAVNEIPAGREPTDVSEGTGAPGLGLLAVMVDERETPSSNVTL